MKNSFNKIGDIYSFKKMNYRVSKKNRIMAAIIAIVMLLSSLSFSVAQTNPDPTATEVQASINVPDIELVDGVYLIYTAAGLVQFRNKVNVDKDTSIDGKLMADINLASYCGPTKGSWLPIGNMWDPYLGHFDGNNKRIYNLYLNLIDESVFFNPEYAAGLFGKIDEGASISKVHVIGDVTSRSNVGGIVGHVVGGTVSDSTYQGKVTILSGSSSKPYGNVGGICGLIEPEGNYLYYGRITSCLNYATINAPEASNTSVGGVVGKMFGTNLEYSGNRGNIVVKGGPDNKIGGVCGNITGIITLRECSNFGNITATGLSANIGGLIGSTESMKIRSSINTGVIESGPGNRDELVGYSSVEPTGTDAIFLVYLPTGIGSKYGKSYTLENLKSTYNLQAYLGADEFISNRNILDGYPIFKYEKSVNDISKNSLFYINTPNELKDYAELVNSGVSDASAILLKDIDLSSVCGTTNGSWTPIKYLDGGTFDGNGKTISNLYINNGDVNLGNQGLFGSLVSGTIKNLNVIGDITISSNNCGGIAASNSGLIENCSFSGKISGENAVGAIAGTNGIEGIIKNSYNKANITGKSDVGGITATNSGLIENCHSESTGGIEGAGRVGGIAGQTTGTINNCYNTSLVKGTNDVGGIAAMISVSGSTVNNCYNTGRIVSNGDDAGGIIGDSLGDITKCYNTGTIASSGKNVGGIVGNSSSLVSLSYNKGIGVTGDSNVGGIIGKNSGKANNCYNFAYSDAITTNAGGLVGEQTGGEFSHSYNVGKVTSANASKGGVAGNLTGGTLINTYYLNTSVSGGNNISGTASRTSEQMKAWNFVFELNKDSYDFSMDLNNKNDGYPVYSSDRPLEGDGTPDNPFLIYDANQLMYYKMFVNEISSTAYGKLMKDIDLSTVCGKDIASSEASWTPIGTSTNGFSGTFDGNHKTIKNLYINTPEENDKGLFKTVASSGKISNLYVVADIKAKINTGGIASEVKSGGLIENCQIDGKITGEEVVGGIAGLVQSGATIQKCSNKVIVRGVNPYLNQPEYSYADFNIGGIAGRCAGTIKSCYSVALYHSAEYTVSVDTDGLPMGGIVGDAKGATISNCYNITGRGTFNTPNIDVRILGLYDSYTNVTNSIFARKDGNPDYDDEINGTQFMYHSGLKDYNQSLPILNNGFTAYYGDYNNMNNGFPVFDYEIQIPKGDGSPESPYLIYTPQQLDAFSKYVNVDGQQNASAKLMRDIDMKDYAYTMIGKSDKPYTGTFDGNGFSVKVAYNTATENTALFSFVGENANIHDINVKGTLTTTKKNVGGLIAQIVGTNVSINRCSSNVDITLKWSSTGFPRYVGGLIGQISSDLTVNINSCYVVGTINKYERSVAVGGMCGIANSGAIVNLKNCYTAIDFPATTVLNDINENFVGFKPDSPAVVNLSNCYYLNQNATSTQGTQKTADEMKTDAFIETLTEMTDNGSKYNVAFIKDAEQRNSGYPILKYEYKTPSGDGTNDSPYTIYTPQQLISFGQYVNDGDKYIVGKIMNDIEMRGYEYYHFGTDTNMFNGTVDGQGFTIKNLNKQSGVPNEKRQGFIYKIGYSGKVINIKFSGADVFYSGQSAVIALENQGEISKCEISDSSIILGNAAELGGISAVNSGTISDCAVVNTTLSRIYGGSYTKTMGGIAQTNNGTIKNSYTYNCSFNKGTSADGAIISSGNAPINCYYYTTSAVSPTYGISKTKEDFAKSEISWLLNTTNNADPYNHSRIWSHDKVRPVFADDKNKAIYKITITGKYTGTEYTVSDGTVESLPKGYTYVIKDTTTPFTVDTNVIQDKEIVADSTEIKVNVYWGSLNYKYMDADQGDWDPSTHTFKASSSIGRWEVAETNGDLVKIENLSVVPLDFSLLYTSSPDVGVINSKFMLGADVLPNQFSIEPKKFISANLVFDGKMKESTVGIKLGTISVSLIKK